MKQSHLLMALLGAVVIVSGCAGENIVDEPEDLPDGEAPPVEDAPIDSEDPVDETLDEEASEEEGEVSDESEVDREITVTGGNYYFDSDDIEVEAGETVRFVFENEGGTHDMVFLELGEGTDVISGGESETFTVTFDEEGEYEFICTVGNHAEQGMTGTVEVV